MAYGSAARRGSRTVVAPLIALCATLAAIAALLNRPARPAPLPGWFARLPAGDESQFFPPATRMRKVRRGVETRNAILAQSDSPLRQTVTPQAGQRLHVTFTITCPPASTCVGGVRFNIAALRGGAREPLLQTRIPYKASPPHWETTSIDLDRLGSAPVTLELSVAPYGPVTGHTRPPAGMWGEPLLVGSAVHERPNVVLISLDTLRADHLGSYGYARPTSPSLDRFAAAGVRFDQAMSQSPWTTPSHMSLFTSLYPTAHRVNQTWEYFLHFLAGRDHKRTLAAAVTTLPEVLRAHGYRTLGLTGGATMTGVLGFAQGFDVYREDAAKLTQHVGAQLNNWFDTFGSDPFFLFFHTFEVHSPYTHPTFTAALLSDSQRADIIRLVGRYAAHDWVNLSDELVTYLRAQGLFRREVTEALYDGGIRAADDFIDGVLTALRQRNLSENTLIVVFSDHGEEFGEHDPDRFYGAHGTSMYDSMIRVPLLLQLPGRFRAGTVVDDQIELIDVAPTILDLLGIAAPAAMQGISLTPLIDGVRGQRKDWAMSEATSKGAELKALRTPDFKYIMTGESHDGERSGVPRQITRELLFDLRNDPVEQHPLQPSDRMSAMRAQLETLLRAIPARTRPGTNRLIDADVHERMRALGYAQ